MARHTFPPESFLPPYRTVPIVELHHALVGKQLGRIWRPKRHTSKTRSPTEKATLRASYSAHSSLMTDLGAGALIAHAYVERTGQFRRITTRYWKEELSGGSLDGAMREFELLEETFARQLQDCTVVVLDRHAEEWLGRHGINERSVYFPEELRPQVLMQSSPHETLYDWAAFEKHASDRLHDEGGYIVSWQQRHLVKEMSVWCEENWGEGSVPDLKLIRFHVKAAHARFLHEKKRNHGNRAYTPG